MPISPETLAIAEKRVDDRAKALHDDLFLANDVLGYDFVPEVHAELFACFPRLDPSKPWREQAEIKNLLVLWPRGHYKSTALIVFIIKCILNFPDIRILIMRGSVGVTTTWLKEILAHFTGQAYGSRLMELFPEFCGTKKQLKGTQTQFTTRARKHLQIGQATVTVASSKSIKTSQHYDLGIFDDLMNESNYSNLRLIDKVTEEFNSYVPLIEGYRIVTGTRWAVADLYSTILKWYAKDGKWIVTVKNCWSDDTQDKPDAEKKPRFPQYKKKNGEIGGFTTEQLLVDIQNEIGPQMFAMQYLLKPIAAVLQHYTAEMFYRNSVPKDNAPALSVKTMMVDLASSGKWDDCVLMIGQTDPVGCAWLTDIRGDQWQPPEIANHIVNMALMHRPGKICFEKSAAAVFFVETLKMVAAQRHVFLPIEFVKIDTKPGAKASRITFFAGVMARNRVKFFMGLPKFDKLVTQAIDFNPTIERYDDYIDCLALLWQELNKNINVIPPPAVKNVILAMVQDAEQRQAAELAHQIIDDRDRNSDGDGETGL